MNLVQNYLKKNRCYTNKIKINVKGIMVHSTGVPQPDVNVFLRNWNSASVSKCVHAFVTEDKVVQTLPWNYKGWHAGGSANKTHIGFEILEPSGFKYSGGANMVGYDVEKNQDYFNKVYRNAVELCAMLCQKYNLNPMKNILCHSEGSKKGIASSHADVMHWFPKHKKDMDQFREDVRAEIESQKKGDPVNPPKAEEPAAKDIMYRVQLGAYSKKDNAIAYQKKVKQVGVNTVLVRDGKNYIVQAGAFAKKENADALVLKIKKLGLSVAMVKVAAEGNKKAKGYKVRVTASVLNVRKGAGTSYGIATAVKKGDIYTIVETKGNWGKLKSGAGWISLAYTEKV